MRKNNCRKENGGKEVEWPGWAERGEALGWRGGR